METEILQQKEIKGVPKLRFGEFEKDLNRVKLDEIVTFKSGGTPFKDNDSFWNGTIPWISATSMVGKYFSESDRKITEEGLINGSKLAPKGSLLLLVRGSMLFNKIPIGIAEKDVAFNQDLKSLLAHHNTSSEFLYQWFSAKQNILLNKVVGTGIGAGKLDTMDLKNLKVFLPSLTEQQKISGFLSAVDKKIQQLSRKKELLETYKKGVMQQLFSHEIRFKDEDGKNFTEWELKKLGEIFRITAGGDVKKENVSQAKTSVFKYPIYANSEKNRGLYGYSDLYKIDSNCITVTGRGALGIANARFEKFYPIVRLLVLKPKKLSDVVFFENLINSYNFFIESTGVPQLTAPQISIYKIKFPCFQEQQKIAGFLSAIDKKIEAVSKQITQTQSFKKGLLQQMFV